MSKTVKELEVTVDQLELGMRVVRLDRPWIETDFLMQGFIIQDQSDIDALVRQCDSVYIEAIYETVAKPERREAPKGLFARRRSAPPPVKVAVQPAGSLKTARVARPAAPRSPATAPPASTGSCRASAVGQAAAERPSRPR